MQSWNLVLNPHSAELSAPFTQWDKPKTWSFIQTQTWGCLVCGPYQSLIRHLWPHSICSSGPVTLLLVDHGWSQNPWEVRNWCLRVSELYIILPSPVEKGILWATNFPLLPTFWRTLLFPSPCQNQSLLSTLSCSSGTVSSIMEGFSKSRKSRWLQGTFVFYSVVSYGNEMKSLLLAGNGRQIRENKIWIIISETDPAAWIFSCLW